MMMQGGGIRATVFSGQLASFSAVRRDISPKQHLQIFRTVSERTRQPDDKEI
jgi:hypothetical protein